MGRNDGGWGGQGMGAFFRSEATNRPSALGFNKVGSKGRRHLLSRNIRVSAGGGSAFGLSVGRDVQEVPDQNCVVVRTADYLELIELQPENAARVLH